MLALLLGLLIPLAGLGDDYADGQAALKRADWAAAVAAFERAAEADRERRDAALYWQAYALSREGRTRQAERRVRELERAYPDSPWLDDARALTVTEESIDRNGGLDEEMRLYALSRLMERDPDRALPLVVELLEQSDSDRTRRDALFILGTSRSEQARQAIATIARDATNPSLQLQAIQALGVGHGPQTRDLLRELFGQAEDPSVQQAIVQAAMIADDDQLLLDAVRQSDHPSVRNAAIQALGATGATGVLHELYAELDDKGNRIAVLQAMAIADDVDGLRRIIRTEQDPDIRVMAVRNIGITGAAEAVPLLEEIYAQAQDRQDRRAVIEALVVLGEEGHSLAMTIAETESDPELQAQAIQTLGVIDATESLQVLYPRVGPEQRRAVLQSMAIAGDADALLAILRSERDPEIRAHVIQALAVVRRTPAIGDALVSLYGEAAAQERDAILNALMIGDDAESLIRLLEQESDPQAKRRILQVLAMMDDEAATDYLFDMIEDN